MAKRRWLEHKPSLLVVPLPVLNGFPESMHPLFFSSKTIEHKHLQQIVVLEQCIEILVKNS
ncbi:hypothetical protein [Phocaeicola sartorii]|uniref:hypothetical protein n=1 Tax=Phocaeicola sartorii TaxID=671267 RepID=UPI003F690D0D